MANNISNNTHKASGQQDWIRIPPSECIPWAIVLTAECLAIVILNIITIIVFVKQREQRRRSTYLIIHLSIVDVLAGAASGPLLIEHRIAEYCHLWKFDFNGNPKLLYLKSVFGFFPVISLINLAVISLERPHATFFSIQASFSQETGIYNCDHYHLADDCRHTSTRTAASSKRLKLLYFIFFVLRYSTLCNFVFLC